MSPVHSKCDSSSSKNEYNRKFELPVNHVGFLKKCKNKFGDQRKICVSCDTMWENENQPEESGKMGRRFLRVITSSNHLIGVVFYGNDFWTSSF